MECSIILSAYCGKKYLRAQLDSILYQSRMPEEIIVIDDCSPDDGETERIIDEYSTKYPNIKKVINPHNMGWAASFMNGISYATKDVVFFSDQDDIWDKDKIISMMRVMENKKINVLISDCQNTDENLNPLEKHSNSGKLESDRFLFGKGFINPKGVGAAMSIRRDFLNKYKELWNPSIGHDQLYQIMAVCFDTFYYLDIPLIYHRFHGGNATGIAKRSFDAQSRIKSIDGYIKLVTCIQESDFWNNLSEDKKEVLQGYIRFGNARRKMLQKRSLFRWLSIVVYGLGYYPSNRTWIGDLICIIKHVKK